MRVATAATDLTVMVEHCTTTTTRATRPRHPKTDPGTSAATTMIALTQCVAIERPEGARLGLRNTESVPCGGADFSVVRAPYSRFSASI